MEKMILGRTGLEVSRSGFGALPIQRVDFNTAKQILLRAYEGGINFYDTASAYSDSEAKMGYSLSEVRDDIIIATKCSGAKNKNEVLQLLETSLKSLKTDHVDILQLHNPDTLPDPDDPESTYAGLIEAQRLGMTRFLGFTNHSRELTLEAAESGLYDTIQFPLSSISSDDDFRLAERCGELNVGFIAMKALCGGLLDDPVIAFSGLRRMPNILPIWGIQRLSELEDFLRLENNPPELNAGLKSRILKEKEALAGDFCRACGYCLPCPEEIPIPMAARMGLIIDRMPNKNYKSEEWQEKMSRIENCQHCGTCSEQCPYDLDTPALLVKNYRIYKEWISGESA